jgi:hypothetical protein
MLKGVHLAFTGILSQKPREAAAAAPRRRLFLSSLPDEKVSTAATSVFSGPRRTDA